MNDTNGGGVEVHTLDKFGEYVAVFNNISDVTREMCCSSTIYDPFVSISNLVKRYLSGMYGQVGAGGYGLYGVADNPCGNIKVHTCPEYFVTHRFSDSF